MAVFLLVCIVPRAGQAAEESPAQKKYIAAVDALGWTHGPALVQIGDQAIVRIPKGVRYLAAAETKRFLQINGNPPQDNSYTIAPETLTWFSILEFEPAGYVSDKEKINAPALFDDLKAGEQESNERRKSLGLSGLHLDRWLVEPHYDAKSHNLEWGTEMHGDDGGKIVNYTSRILGREGITRATLVTDPRYFSSDLDQYRVAMAGFSYSPAKKYEDFRSGDKMAAYGLGALVAGGAAAAVVKSGAAVGIFAILAKIGAVFFKFIAVVAVGAVAAVGGWIKRLFGRKADD